MTDDPQRWADDSLVPPRLRQDLRAVRKVPPPAYDTEAGLLRLKTALSAGGAGAAATSGKAIALKWLLLAGVTISAGVGAWATWVGDDDARPDESIGGRGTMERLPDVAAAPIGPAHAPAEAHDAPAPESEDAPTTAPPARDRTVEIERAGARPAAKKTGPFRPAVEERPATGAADETGGSARLEIAQLAKARRLLASDPSAALALAEQGQRRFPEGLFSEERAAIALFALHRLGRVDQVRARAERFLARHPNGPFSARVRALAGEQ